MFAPPPLFLEKKCSMSLSEDECKQRAESSTFGSLSFRFDMIARSTFFFLAPMDGGSSDFISHISANSSHLLSEIIEFAGVLLSFLLKSKGPMRKVLGLMRFILSLNLPYFFRSGFDRGERSTRRP